MVGRRDPSLTMLLSLLLTTTLLLPSSAPSNDNDGVYRLLVLHTNDMHSHFDESNRDGSGSSETCGQACYGGFARVKTAVDSERSLAAATDGTLFLNAGDTFQGTPFFTYFGWSAAASMINMLGIDVMNLGNHEFDVGVDEARQFVQNVTAPVVSCNLDLSGEPSLAAEPNLMKSKVLTVKGRKIGIIGYLTPETMHMASVGNMKILPEIPSIEAEVKRLKDDGVDIIIALGHSGFEMDVKIAKQVKDIDVVIGGHSHTFLYSGDPPDIEKPDGTYPYWVEQPETKRRVPVVQAFHITKYLGKLWIEFNSKGEVINSYGNPILLDSSINQDKEVVKAVQLLHSQIKVQTQQVLGISSIFLEGNSEYCRIRECSMGNVVTDLFVDYNVRKHFNSFDLTKQWTNAPIAMIISGTIRININSSYENGVVTKGSLLSVLPFQNVMGTITTKGSSIWNAFEHSVWRYNGVQQFGEFLQVSGLKVVIDLGRPSGQRVVSVDARCGDCVVPVYRKLNLDGDYTVIMSEYFANGGDGYKFEKVVDFVGLGALETDILTEEFRMKSPIWSEVGGRIVLLNSRESLQTVD